MQQYAAIDKDSKVIMSYPAENELDALKVLTIMLRGRPGFDYYKQWCDNNKEVKEV